MAASLPSSIVPSRSARPSPRDSKGSPGPEAQGFSSHPHHMLDISPSNPRLADSTASSSSSSSASWFPWVFASIDKKRRDRGRSVGGEKEEGVWESSDRGMGM